MGYYCRICGTVKANEKFSGKGHKRHICKKCSKLPATDREDLKILNKIYGLFRYDNLSKVNRRMLEGYLKHKSEKIRAASEEMLNQFSRTKYDDIYESDLEDYDGDLQDEKDYEDFETCFDEISDDDDLPF